MEIPTTPLRQWARETFSREFLREAERDMQRARIGVRLGGVRWARRAADQSPLCTVCRRPHGREVEHPCE